MPAPRGAGGSGGTAYRGSDMTHRLLLDTSSLTYRAFFAVPSSITDPAGRPVNAVRGVLDMHARLLADHRPDEVVHVFDADWRPAARVEAYAGYKAARPADPEGLPEQFDLLAEVLDAFGLPRVDAPGWEADDAIGTLCAEAAAGDRVDVVTGDRDLLQLVVDEPALVRVLFTVRGVSTLTTFDEAAVRGRYGIAPARYVDFAILRGDASDGLPGIKGVGDKTAATLVRAFPSLDDLAAVAAEAVAGGRRPAALSPAVARAIAAADGYLEAMQQVVPVRRDLALRWVRADPDPARRRELAVDRALEGPMRRLEEALHA
jgi:5'-3' exonuclease